MPDAQSLIRKLSSTYDDDDANDAVDGLVRLGRDAVGPLAGLLTVAALTERTSKCEPLERQRYVLKALRRIGDRSAVAPILGMYAELDQFLGSPEGADRVSLTRFLQGLVDVARVLDPAATAGIPAAVADQRAAARAAVDQILAQRG